jgi:hypothetical protein
MTTLGINNEYIKNIRHNMSLIYFMIKMYIHIYTIRIINYILRIFGYTRVYDLDSGNDLTIIYHIIKIIPHINLPITFDITYQRLGICTYIDEKYVRYVCYNTKLLSIIKNSNELSSKKYHSIKKIELIPLTKDTINDNNIIDITSAKNQLYDVGNFTRFYDVIRFYQIINNVFATYDTYDKYMSENMKSIYIHREYFDENLLEFINSYEEVYIETN